MPPSSSPSLTPKLHVQTKCNIESDNSAIDRSPSYFYRKGGDNSDTLVQRGFPFEGAVGSGSSRFARMYNKLTWKNVTGRIVGGTPADITDYPWQVSLHSSYSHQCGGSVLTNSWVLTASHCKEAGVFPSDWMAYLGVTNLAKIVDGVSHTSPISAIIQPFPMWDKDSYARDVALFRLQVPVVYSEFIMPICIGKFPKLTHGSPVNVSGFGDTVNRDDESFQASDQLNSVDVLIVSKEICQNWYKEDHVILADQICAGHETGGKDSCVGDSGGPLVKKELDSVLNGYSWYQVGIVSFGFECAKPKEPGIYASVDYHRTWIRSAMRHFDENFV